MKNKIQAMALGYRRLLEVIFTPMDEKNFNQKIRDVSNGVK